jgi:hypothetical protein
MDYVCSPLVLFSPSIYNILYDFLLLCSLRSMNYTCAPKGPFCIYSIPRAVLCVPRSIEFYELLQTEEGPVGKS